MGLQKGTCPVPFNSAPMGVNPASPARPPARPHDPWGVRVDELAESEKYPPNPFYRPFLRAGKNEAGVSNLETEYVTLAKGGGVLPGWTLLLIDFVRLVRLSTRAECPHGGVTHRACGRQTNPN